MKDKYLDFGKIVLKSNAEATSENTIDLGYRPRSVVGGFVELTIPSSLDLKGNISMTLESADTLTGTYVVCGSSRPYTPAEIKGDTVFEKGKVFHGQMTKIRMPLPFDMGRYIRLSVKSTGEDAGKVLYGNIEPK